MELKSWEVYEIKNNWKDNKNLGNNNGIMIKTDIESKTGNQPRKHRAGFRKNLTKIDHRFNLG